jgi:hypothetical protein
MLNIPRATPTGPAMSLIYKALSQIGSGQGSLDNVRHWNAPFPQARRAGGPKHLRPTNPRPLTLATEKP